VGLSEGWKRTFLKRKKGESTRGGGKVGRTLRFMVKSVGQGEDGRRAAVSNIKEED